MTRRLGPKRLEKPFLFLFFGIASAFLPLVFPNDEAPSPKMVGKAILVLLFRSGFVVFLHRAWLCPSGYTFSLLAISLWGEVQSSSSHHFRKENGVPLS